MSTQDPQYRQRRAMLKVLRDNREILEKDFASILKSASIFLLPLDLEDVQSVETSHRIERLITSRLDTVVDLAPITKFKWGTGASETACLQRFVFRNVSPDTVRHEIEQSMLVLAHDQNFPEASGRLGRYGLFIPRIGTITCKSFAHGDGHYYRYRLATFKLDTVPRELSKFLISVSSECPDRYFSEGPRASHLDVPVLGDVVTSNTHAIMRLAEDGLKVRKLKSAHEDLEKYLLECDPETIACELPVWFTPDETDQMAWLKTTGKALTGHIDILRHEHDGLIGIWDYKPSASDETTAHIQVFHYALMLSRRTGLALSHFRCGYFDSTVALFFSPSEMVLG